MESDFSLSVRIRDGESLIECDGELDISTCHNFEVAVDLCFRQQPATIHADLRGVTFIAAAGIAQIVRLVERCRTAGVDLRFDLSPPVRRILDLVGLWWIGVIDDGIAVQNVLHEALQRYAEASSDGTLRLDDARRGGLGDARFGSPSAEAGPPRP